MLWSGVSGVSPSTHICPALSQLRLPCQLGGLLLHVMFRAPQCCLFPTQRHTTSREERAALESSAFKGQGHELEEREIGRRNPY